MVNALGVRKGMVFKGEKAARKAPAILHFWCSCITQLNMHGLVQRRMDNPRKLARVRW